MDRRCAVSSVALLGMGVALPPWAQRGRVARVAWVSMELTNPEAPFWVGFRRGMRELRWTEGENIIITPWWADGSLDRLKQQLPDITASRPDVIVVATGTAVPAIIDAGVQQPIVFAYSADPVVGKIVQSWAKPGVNRTGISYFSLELLPKRIEFIKQLMPQMKRMAIVGWPPHAGELLELERAKVAADQLSLSARYWGVATAAEVDAALMEIETWRAEAILVFGGAVAAQQAGRFAAFGTARRIPAISAWAAFADAGNLMTYGPSIQEAQVRLASFVDRILKGGKASEIPVELPTKIELVFNLKVAKAIGVDVPAALLLRADRVIE
ncbi:MAG TPA: ABC transporter substrate-binding protein [Burkholderiaceae bacterium]|nr:ABC transporter substrate-binding protein [Burkholderiaceae bacterium]